MCEFNVIYVDISKSHITGAVIDRLKLVDVFPIE